MKTKKKVTKKAPKGKSDYVPTDLKIGVKYEKKFHIPMGGYHNNYADFDTGKHKGTIVFVGGTIGVSIDSEHSFSFSTRDLVEFCLKKLKKGHNAKK